MKSTFIKVGRLDVTAGLRMSNTCDLILPLNLGIKVEFGSKLVDVLGIISTGIAGGVGGWVPAGTGGIDSGGVDGWVISGTGGVPEGIAGTSTGGVDQIGRAHV